jgi:hypothetical protein
MWFEVHNNISKHACLLVDGTVFPTDHQGGMRVAQLRLGANLTNCRIERIGKMI